jgi:hypothetical protein
MASAPSILVQHGTIALARPRRLLTSCAHRLGKPHRIGGPLTPSVTRRVPEHELSSARPDGSLVNGYPCHEAHRIRPHVTSACLRPWRPGARTPSIGSISGFASEAGLRSPTVRLRALAQHPFTRYESTLLVKEEPPRQATPSRLDAPFGALHPGREDASFRLLQPTTRHEHSN